MKKQRTRQAVDVIIRKKKNKSPPVRIAPITLVATNSTASKTIERSTVPRMPASNAVTMLHKPSQHLLRKEPPETRATARYTTAIPRVTHKNAGVRVIAAVILRNAVIIPIIRLATTAKPTQPKPQLLQDVDILFTSTIILCEKYSSGEKCNTIQLYKRGIKNKRRFRRIANRGGDGGDRTHDLLNAILG